MIDFRKWCETTLLIQHPYLTIKSETLHDKDYTYIRREDGGNYFSGAVVSYVAIKAYQLKLRCTIEVENDNIRIEITK